jgi:hypothetical protein
VVLVSWLTSAQQAGHETEHLWSLSPDLTWSAMFDHPLEQWPYDPARPPSLTMCGRGRRVRPQPDGVTAQVLAVPDDEVRSTTITLNGPMGDTGWGNRVALQGSQVVVPPGDDGAGLVPTGIELAPDERVIGSVEGTTGIWVLVSEPGEALPRVELAWER